MPMVPALAPHMIGIDNWSEQLHEGVHTWALRTTATRSWKVLEWFRGMGGSEVKGRSIIGRGESSDNRFHMG